MNQVFGVIGIFALIVLATMATIIACGIIRGFIIRKRMQKEMVKVQNLKKGENQDGSSSD